jgi:hypothetical protein
MEKNIYFPSQTKLIDPFASFHMKVYRLIYLYVVEVEFMAALSRHGKEKAASSEREREKLFSFSLLP